MAHPLQRRFLFSAAGSGAHSGIGLETCGLEADLDLLGTIDFWASGGMQIDCEAVGRGQKSQSPLAANPRGGHQFSFGLE